MTDFSNVYEKSKNSLVTILSDSGAGFSTSSGFITSNNQGKKFIVTTAHSVLITPETWGMDGILYRQSNQLGFGYYKTIDLAIPENTNNVIFRTQYKNSGSTYLDSVVLKENDKVIYRDTFRGNKFGDRWENGDGLPWSIQKYGGRMLSNAAKSGNSKISSDGISTLLLKVNNNKPITMSVTFKNDFNSGSFIIGYCNNKDCSNRVSKNILGFYNNEIHQLRVIGLDGKGDIAILLPSDGSDLDNIQSLQLIRNSRSVQKGTPVAVMGNPLGLDVESISSGVIRDNRYALNSSIVESILTSAPVFAGNSGSPYVLLNGQVVGMLTWGLSAGRLDDSSFNGGPSSTLILQVLNNLTSQNYDNSYNDYEKGYTGLKLIGLDLSIIEALKIPMKGTDAKFKPSGYLVAGLENDSPLVNILEPNDIITGMKSKNIDITLGSFDNQSSISEITWYTSPEDLLTITFLRYNKVTQSWESYEAKNVELIKFPSTKDIPLSNTMDIDVSKNQKKVNASFKVVRKLENNDTILNNYFVNENI